MKLSTKASFFPWNFQDFGLMLNNSFLALGCERFLMFFLSFIVLHFTLKFVIRFSYWVVVVCAFQGIGPCHLSCQIYACRVVRSILSPFGWCRICTGTLCFTVDISNTCIMISEVYYLRAISSLFPLLVLLEVCRFYWSCKNKLFASLIFSIKFVFYFIDFCFSLFPF